MRASRLLGAWHSSECDGVLDAEELKAIAADTKLAANAKAKAAVDGWLVKGL